VSTAFAIKLKRSGSSAEVPIGSTSVVSEVQYTDRVGLSDMTGDWQKQKLKIWWWHGGIKNKKSSQKEAIQEIYTEFASISIFEILGRELISRVGSQNLNPSTTSRSVQYCGITLPDDCKSDGFQLNCEPDDCMKSARLLP
jgi:hypothetical protein